ncbi:MAG: biotin--[acetyl-CoA-carboxylase] ligase [Muribaculaceae bacterium]|nr:biotin--[acetyl-CoA-carboxylase] ligase [Muribaculaceae bacterium]
MNIIELDEVTSTNSYMADHAGSLPADTVVVAHSQTAGRGQRGNSWEAEPGKNLTFSLLLRPTSVTAVEQFLISRAVSVGIAQTLQQFTRGSEEVCIKWPNDIYVGAQKIAGILIENSLMGNMITRSIVGIGLNVNQLQFRSDAPNPVSVIHLRGQETPLRPLLEQVVESILGWVARLDNSEGREAVTRAYDSMLWRREGLHPYITADGEPFQAELIEIAPDGIMTLRDTDGKDRRFAFKEVHFVI